MGEGGEGGVGEVGEVGEVGDADEADFACGGEAEGRRGGECIEDAGKRGVRTDLS